MTRSIRWCLRACAVLAALPRPPRPRWTSAASGRPCTTRTTRNAFRARSSPTTPGLPLNDAARLQADSWDADRISVVSSYQCRPHSSDYGMRGLGNLRVWAELDVNQQLLAFHTYMPAWGSERTIWMDGRPHPPEYAEYTFQGFSTGVWEGNMLTITTTHLKTNYYRRNGVPASDRRTVVEHWTRHAEFLTVVTVVTDPVFLTEPLVRSQNWFNDVGQALPAFTCEYAVEAAGRAEGAEPSAGHQPVSHRVRGLVRAGAGRDARRRRDDVSRVPA